MSEMLELADRLFEAVASGDIETVSNLYRDDIAAWHNWDGVSQTKEENLATLSSIPERYDTFGYTDARTVEVEGGFLRQHNLRAGRNGNVALIPAILRVYVEDGQVHRIEEYFDYGQLQAALS